jgi:hypothetical protein
MRRRGSVVNRLCERASLSNQHARSFWEKVVAGAYLSISARITSMTSSGRRAMFLCPRSIVIPGCCCWRSRGTMGVSPVPRWVMSWRDWVKAALARATTSSSEMGVGASLLMARKLSYCGGSWCSWWKRGTEGRRGEQRSVARKELSATVDSTLHHACPCWA